MVKKERILKRLSIKRTPPLHYNSPSDQPSCVKLSTKSGCQRNTLKNCIVFFDRRTCIHMYVCMCGYIHICFYFLFIYIYIHTNKSMAIIIASVAKVVVFCSSKSPAFLLLVHSCIHLQVSVSAQCSCVCLFVRVSVRLVIRLLFRCFILA